MNEEENNQQLINNADDLEIKIDKKTISLKIKIAIIIIISVIILSIVATVIILILKNDEQSDESSNSNILPIIIEPTSEYTHCIIWLHGLDNSPENFVDLFGKEVPFLKKSNTKIILLRAPYQNMTYNNKSLTSWFDILTWPIDDPDSYNFTDAIKSRKVVEKVINEEAKKLNGQYNKIFIGGHSQGACVSLYTAYNFEELLGGVLVCSGILFPQGEIVGDKNKLNVFLGHGTGDKAIPLSFHNETIKRIENFEGVRKYYYQGKGHDVHTLEKADMSGFLNETMI